MHALKQTGLIQLPFFPETEAFHQDKLAQFQLVHLLPLFHGQRLFSQFDPLMPAEQEMGPYVCISPLNKCCLGFQSPAGDQNMH